MCEELMGWIFSWPDRKKSGIKTYGKHLKEFSDQELYYFMQNNEEIHAANLACFCSEILRRMLEKQEKTE